MLKKSDCSKYPILTPTESQSSAPDRIRVSDLKEGLIVPITSSRGQAAILVLENGQPKAFDARCPHMGSDLTKAKCITQSGALACSWHGYRYSIKTGAFMENPNESMMLPVRNQSEHFDPQSRPPYKIREHKIEIEDGWIRVV